MSADDRLIKIKNSIARETQLTYKSERIRHLNFKTESWWSKSDHLGRYLHLLEKARVRRTDNILRG